MKLILGALNKSHLIDLHYEAQSKTSSVTAAVAYATTNDPVFDWCLENEIPLKFYGRWDDGVPVSVDVLKKFIDHGSSRYVCKLVQHHHAKVIWWHGFGVYVGSANITKSAWGKNIEAGVFVAEDDIDDSMDDGLKEMFLKLEQYGSPLTRELYDFMQRRNSSCIKQNQERKNQPKHDGLIEWNGLLTMRDKPADEKRRAAFMREWYETLEILRKIGAKASSDEFRPRWIDKDVSPGAQADQFLHAFYFGRTFNGQRANYESHYHQNATDPERALETQLAWWRDLPSPPHEEDITLFQRAPLLRQKLSQAGLASMTAEDVMDILENTHASRDYALRVRNNLIGLKTTAQPKTRHEKLQAMATTLFASQSEHGKSFKEILEYVLYGGPLDETSSRLWDAHQDPKWKIDLVGLSTLGELVGWANPDNSPPRNGRTSKGLRASGFDVSVHSGAESQTPYKP